MTKLSGDNVVRLVTLGTGVFVLWTAGRFIRSAGESLGVVVPDLGPPAQLTQGARGREAAMINAGYLERLSDGSTRITDAGEEYIERQRQAQETNLGPSVTQ